MQLVDKEFLHFQYNRPDYWHVGDVLLIGEKFNPFYTNLRTEGSLYHSFNKNHYSIEHVFEVLKRYYSGIETQPRPELLELYENKLEIVKLGLKAINAYGNIAREIVFERLRAQKFPLLPSRCCCVWLIPNDSKESLVYWKNQLKINERGGKLFRVKANGVGHLCNSQFLEDSCNIQEFEDYAVKYWKGLGVHLKTDEMLFIGELQVMEELDVTLIT